MRAITELISSIFPSETERRERARAAHLEELQKQSQGKPFVLDENGLRFLYFSTACVQSVMRIEKPNELMCGYTRAMMGFVLTHPTPKHILMIGLGGGSLVKFCYHYLPHTKITAVEINPDVVALRDHFAIPPDDARLHIITADAVEYLATAKQTFDVIILDGFDIEGMAEEINSANFYRTCQTALTPDGVLVANMWGKRKILAPVISELREVFHYRVQWCRSLDSYNLIVFAYQSTPCDKQVMLENAKAWDNNLQLQLGTIAKKLQTLPTPRDSQQTQVQDPVLLAAARSIRDQAQILVHLKDLLAPDPNLAKNEGEWGVEK